MKRRAIFVTTLTVIFAFIVLGCGAQSKWNDGEFQGTAEGMHGELSVNVIIDGGKITKIDMLTQNETAGLGDVAVEKVSQEIIDTQSTEVDTVSGASESSNTTITAVNDALEKATK